MKTRLDRATEQALACQEEWQVAAFVFPMKSCRLSANGLESLRCWEVTNYPPLDPSF